MEKIFVFVFILAFFGFFTFFANAESSYDLDPTVPVEGMEDIASADASNTGISNIVKSSEAITEKEIKKIKKKEKKIKKKDLKKGTKKRTDSFKKTVKKANAFGKTSKTKK